MGAKKNFVIDTNVILHDYNCLKNFQENDIYLPIVVLEELDNSRKVMSRLISMRVSSSVN
jgi:PhoH-like ATPase